jgi:hypothetical protein
MSIEGNSAPILSLATYLSGKGQIVPMKANESVKNRLLVIPPWQREYVWSASENGQVGVLLEDLADFVRSSENDYLMGSILLCHSPEESHHRLIIDGQQRTLTFTILIMAVLKHITNKRLLTTQINSNDANLVKNNVDKMYDESALTTLMSECISENNSFYQQKLSMPHQKADKILQSLFAWTKIPDGEESDLFLEEKEHWTQTQRNLVSVAVWIYEKKLKTEDWVKDSDLLVAMKKIMNNVKFLQVTLSTQKEAIAIFDRINSRGADLNSGDLIKNRIFQSVESDEDFQSITESWSKMNVSLANCSLKRMREPKFLLRALALENQDLSNHLTEDTDSPDTKKNAPKITYEQLTSYWGERLDSSVGHQHKIKKINPFDFAEKLVESSEWLQKLSIEKNIKDKPLKELYFSRYLNSVQHYPMLIAGRHIEDFSVLELLVRQVHNRTAFYLLSEERTQDFEAMVPTWTALISKVGSKATVSELNEIYNNHIKVNENQIDALISQMKLWSYRSPEKKKIRAVLSQLTRIVDKVAGREDRESPESYFYTKKDTSKDTKNSKAWDIEHIQPSKGASKDSELHTIGNLVLLYHDHNSLKKAVKPSDKIDVYKDSHLKLTQSLIKITVDVERKKVEDYFKKISFPEANWNIDNWDSKSIKSRSDLYAAILKHHLTTLD